MTKRPEPAPRTASDVAAFAGPVVTVVGEVAETIRVAFEERVATIDWSGETPAPALFVDLDRGAPDWADLESRLVPGGALVLFGSHGRPVDRVRPAFPSRSALHASLTKAGLTVRFLPIRDPAWMLVRASRPEAAPSIEVEASTVPVTVCIPTAGRSPWLGESLQSIVDQSARPEKTIVVSDGNPEPVRAVLARHPDVVHHVIEPKGQGAAMNEALRHVRTKYVAWLDDDDRFVPNKLRLQTADLEAHPDASMSATDHYAIDPQGNVLLRQSLPAVDPEQVPRLLLGGSYFLGPTVVVPTDRYRTIGDAPYDESLERVADYPMWFRLASLGSVRTLPLALSEIRRHGGNRATPERIRAMRDSARETLAWVRGEFSIERLFPMIGEASTPAERAEAVTLALIERAGHSLRVGLVEEALEDLRGGLATAPDDARLRHFLALTLMEAGELEEATTTFEAAGRVGAPQAEVQCGLGTIAFWRGDEAAARDHFRRATAADPSSVIARYNALLVDEGEGGALALCRDLLAGGRPHGYLLSPSPPLEPTERELVRLRRSERGVGR